MEKIKFVFEDTQEEVEFNNYVSISQQDRLESQLSVINTALGKDVTRTK